MELSPAKRALLEKWLKGQQSKKAEPEIPPRPNSDLIPLSLPQQRQLFLELLDRGTAVNNLSVLIEMKGKLDQTALKQSANQILARHDVLRTCFNLGQGTPIPEINDDIQLKLPVVDLRSWEGSEPEIEARRLAEKEVLQAFDLSQAPLIRLKLFVLGKEKYLLLVIAHHTIADGWSLGVFLRELMAFYESNISGKAAKVNELPIQYADYAHWQTTEKRKESLQASISYWKETLAGELPLLELPTDQQRASRQSFSGGTHRFVLSKELTKSLEELSREVDVTLFMTLLAGFNILLHRYSGQKEILVGTPIANRNYPELEPLMGVFINTLVLRTKLSGDLSFRELLKQVRKLATDAYAHQDLPFEKLVEELKPKRDLSRTPLFQVVFNLQSSPLPKLEMEGMETSFVEIDRGVSQFDLTLMMSRIEGECLATVEYNSDIFRAETIKRMFEAYQLLLKSAVGDANGPIFKLPLTSQEEMNKLIVGLNQTAREFPRDKYMHQLFEAQVELSPDAIAVVFEEKYLSYHELNQRANALANKLREFDFGSNLRVAILMNRSLATTEALLAVLKAGGSYVPIHTSFPTERIQFVIKDSNAQVLLTNVELDPIKENEVQIINLSDEILPLETHVPNPKINISPDDLAYIIYTSGSTGKPKGVMINHSSLVNFLCSMRVKPGLEKEDVLLAVTSISFDIAALELYLPLIVGAKVVIASEEMKTNPVLIGDALEEHQVSVMQATPATWQLLLKTAWAGRPNLKALCGGEALSRKLANKLLKRVDSLWNMYGPTETTIWSSISSIQRDQSPITIGRPIDNTQLYILDQYLQATPIGVVGELLIGGDGLARGYLNRPQLTNEKFIPDHFSSQAGTRLYKTGDLARYLADGSIEILGRKDDQVKINGHRMELGEISTMLTQHPSVHDGIVITQKENFGEPRLVAYFVPKPGVSLEADELRNFFLKKLPSYMTPTLYLELASLPLNPSGKIDRKALPMLHSSRQISDYVAARNEEEQILVKIWQNVLELEQLGIHDNFFDLGGASIQSLQIVAKANMFGFKLRVEHIFEYQTIAELAAFLKKDLQ